MSDIESHEYELKIDNIYLPASLEEDEVHLLAGICKTVSTKAANNRDESSKYWDGKIFQDFVDSMPSAHHQVFLRLLERYGIKYGGTFKKIHKQGIGLKTAENVFCYSAKAQGIPLKLFLRKYVTYCQSEGIELKAFESHRKAVDKILNASQSLPENKASIKEPPAIQPRLTIPKPKAGNDNYYANAALDVIGRQKEKELLEAFLLECDLNVAWFQLAGVAGQGKSRLAFDLVNFANSQGWTAGFLRENDIQFFKDKWAQWQPDKPHLLVFDYVIGREHEIKPIVQSLTFRQGEFSNRVRILLLERQPWNRGTAYNIEGKQSDGISLSMDGANRAPWFLQLCEMEDYDGETLVDSSFADGVVELKNLTEDELLDIVKQLVGQDCAVSDTDLKKTLMRIDDSGRPLYAYLLARQIIDNPQHFQSWTKTDLLNGQLKRDKLRWEKAFAQNAPTWGNSHPAMKLAVLATIGRNLEFDDDFIKQHFGKVDLDLSNQALAIASANHNSNDDRPREIYSIEPDLLGEWFVLLCFHKGLEFQEIIDMAWLYKPNETAEFIQRISLDFPRDPMASSILDHLPPDETSSNALAAIAVQVMLNLRENQHVFPNTILAHVEMAANAGDACAMNILGYLFRTGKGLERNIHMAIEWYRKGAEAGDGGAMTNLGTCYLNGVGVEQDFAKAVEWYQKGIDVKHGGAMTNIGLCYSTGKGVEQNFEKALEWHLLGADTGIGVAMHHVAHCYYEGKGAERDYAKAVDWYRRGARAGEGASMRELGLCYGRGHGVKPDIANAVEWLRKGAAAGDGASMYYLGRSYQRGQGVEQDFVSAVEWFHKGAAAGDGDAMNSLGNCYHNGQGVERNFEKAVEWCRKGAEAGNAKAMLGLAVCYESGAGVEQDFSQAAEWCRKGAEAGEGGAMYGLGMYYQNGKGVDQSFEKAVEWYRKGVEAGDTNSMISLGMCYQNGMGVEQGFEEARIWYEKSLLHGNEGAKSHLRQLRTLSELFCVGTDKTDRSDELWAGSQANELVQGGWEHAACMPGTWSDIEQKNSIGILMYLRQAFRAADALEALDNKAARRMRVLPLEFYPDYLLLEAEFYCPSYNALSWCAAIISNKSAILLNGESNLIHTLNKYLLILTSEKAIRDYLAFFCRFVLADGSSFSVVSNLNELKLSSPQAVLPDKVKKEFFPIRWTGGTFEQNGYQAYEVCVLHSKSFFSVKIEVSQDGEVNMPDDYGIAENLPVLEPRHDGFFYHWC